MIKKFMLFISLIGFNCIAYSQSGYSYYFQDYDFNFSPVINSKVINSIYVRDEFDNFSAHLHYLASNTSGLNSISVSGGTLNILTSGPGSGWVAIKQPLNYNIPPKEMQVKFKANIDVRSTGSEPKWFCYVGNSGWNFGDDRLNMESTNRMFSGFSIRYADSGYYYVKTLNNGGSETVADRIPDLTNVVFTFVANGGFSTIYYVAPDGSSESLGVDKFDLWINNVKRFDDEAATTPGIQPHFFKFGDFANSNGGHANWILDSVRFSIPVMAPLSFIPSGLSATTKGSGIEVKWQTNNDVNVEHYEIDRSSNSSSFSKIGSHNSMNSTSEQIYYWVDDNPLPGNNFYRIKSLNIDGSVKYSSIVKVSSNKSQPSLTVAPNPVKGNVFNLKVNNINKGNYSLEIVNVMGQKVYVEKLQLQSGSSTVNVTFPNSLKSGIYNINLSGDAVMIQSQILKE